jgi:hypothetical protein
MATTTNYGWTTPDDTALVKDGAAAIRTLGSSVDTTTKALNPSTTLGDIEYRSSTANTNTRLPIGTNGQVLAVVGGVPAWQNGTTGDIEGVTAGTGISGGGTSGTVTITNSMATAITTNGDFIYGTGSGTFTRLGIGSTGQVLTVAGGVPSWATPAGGVTFSGCSAYNTSNLSIADTTWTTVTYNTERYDTDSYHSTSTNTSRFTIPTGKTGYFLISVTMAFSTNTTGSRNAKLIVNGSDIRNLSQQSSPSSFIDTFGAVLPLTAADYVELQVLQTSGGSLNLSQGITTSWFDIAYLGA